MLAYHLIIDRVNAPEDAPSLATWFVDPGGLHWLDDLVQAGKATAEGNGYPFRFHARAGDVLPLILDGPPDHEGPFIVGEDYVLPGAATWEVELDREQIAQCRPEEMLRIVAWDQS